MLLDLRITATGRFPVDAGGQLPGMNDPVFGDTETGIAVALDRGVVGQARVGDLDGEQNVRTWKFRRYDQPRHDKEIRLEIVPQRRAPTGLWIRVLVAAEPAADPSVEGQTYEFVASALGRHGDDLTLDELDVLSRRDEADFGHAVEVLMRPGLARPAVGSARRDGQTCRVLGHATRLASIHCDREPW